MRVYTSTHKLMCDLHNATSPLERMCSNAFESLYRLYSRLSRLLIVCIRLMRCVEPLLDMNVHTLFFGNNGSVAMYVRRIMSLLNSLSYTNESVVGADLSIVCSSDVVEISSRAVSNKVHVSSRLMLSDIFSGDCLNGIRCVTGEWCPHTWRVFYTIHFFGRVARICTYQ
jgi:hypothetical protein